jgi:hypothetical protein
VVSTVFWVGELPSENNPTPNTASAWDVNWQSNFGGYDHPEKRNGYLPADFVPALNPFYIALPYNDIGRDGKHRPEASSVIPWFWEDYRGDGISVCKDRWVSIHYNGRVCYAQWEDCGPFVTDDVEYVFGNARPKNNQNNGAGIDVSPAVRDFLGLGTNTKIDWRFVDMNEIPDGPWRTYGTNNPFVRARVTEKANQNNALASRLEELRRMRDEYFRQNGSGQYQNR